MPDALGMIGLGLLGGALAARFRQGGLSLIGFDPRPEARQALAALGGVAAASARDVIARCDRALLCLPDSPTAAQVIEEAEGAWRRGHLVIDTTTGAPQDAEAHAGRLAARGAQFVDATVLGSSEQARAGEVVVMAGGEADAVARAADLFAHFAARWFHVGPAGSGARMKLVVNLVLGLNRAALAEGLALAAGLGLGQPAALEVLSSGAAYSRVMDIKGPKMLAGDFTPQARLAQHLKDVRLILGEAARAGLRLPLTAAHRELLERVVAMGGGEQDNSAVIRAYGPTPAGASTPPPPPPPPQGEGGPDRAYG